MDPRGPDVLRAPFGARGVLLTVAAAAVLAYANSIPNGWALDDDAILPGNVVVTEGRVGEALEGPWWRVEPEWGLLYRPVTLLGFAAEWRLWGDEEWAPHAFHAVNVVWHAGATALATLLFLRLVSPPVALFGGLLFAVHPVHTEAVANVVGRAELMAAVGVLAGCLLFLWRPRAAGGRVARAVGIGGAYAFALGSKEIGVTLPALLLLLALLPPRPGRDRKGAPGLGARLREELPTGLLLAAVLGVYLLFRWSALGSLVGEDLPAELVGTSGAERLMTALTLWTHYARLMVFPLELLPDYGPGVLEAARSPGPQVIAGGAVLAATLGLIFALRRRAPAVSLGLAWFVVAVLPVAHLGVHAGVLLAERALYLPSVGATLALAAGGAAWARRSGAPDRRVAAVGALVVVLMGARTVARNPAWTSTIELMRRLAVDRPESHRAHRLYADFLLRSGRVDDAVEAQRRAVAVYPNRYDVLAEAGIFFNDVGRPGEAVPLLERARELSPRRRAAHRILAESHLLRREGRRAHRAALRGIARAGPDRVLWARLSESYLLRGDLEGALRARRAALAADPESAHDWRRLAEILEGLGATSEAAEARSRADRLEADGAPEGSGP